MIFLRNKSYTGGKTHTDRKTLKSLWGLDVCRCPWHASRTLTPWIMNGESCKRPGELLTRAKAMHDTSPRATQIRSQRRSLDNIGRGGLGNQLAPVRDVATHDGQARDLLPVDAIWAPDVCTRPASAAVREAPDQLKSWRRCRSASRQHSHNATVSTTLPNSEGGVPGCRGVLDTRICSPRQKEPYWTSQAANLYEPMQERPRTPPAERERPQV